MERYRVAFEDLVGLVRLDLVEVDGGGPPPMVGHFLNLVTDIGRFTFEHHFAYRDPTPAISRDGYWEPNVTIEGLGLVVMCRVAPNGHGVYCVDEATGLVVLEFGYLTRADDPNLRGAYGGMFRWEGGAGWESPHLDVPEEVDGIEIARKFDYTPKRVGASPRKGRF